MDDPDWDLQAVVRGCCSAVSSAATTATTTTVSSFPPEVYNNQQKSTLYGDDNNIGVLTFFPDLFQPRNDINSIEHFMNDVFYPQKQKQPPPPPPTPPQSFQISPFSFLGGFQDPTYNQQQQQKRQFQIKQESLGISRCTTSHAQGTTKIKKRKNQTKRVCQVPFEGPSPDFWSWRKYGQKPIKGSPYPRGYYKCSTLKGCSARKQVERNRSDPGTLIITYTGEHTHPVPSQLNSLSGSTRNKTTTIDDISNKPTPSPPISPEATVPPVLENEPERYFTDDEDNTFDGLDELVGPATGDVFSGHMPVDPATGFHWLSNNLVVKTTTTAAGGS